MLLAYLNISHRKRCFAIHNSLWKGEIPLDHLSLLCRDLVSAYEPLAKPTYSTGGSVAPNILMPAGRFLKTNMPGLYYLDGVKHRPFLLP